MDVYVIEGPAVAVSWDRRGPLMVLGADGLPGQSWKVPDDEDRLRDIVEREEEIDKAVEEAEGAAREDGRKEGRNEAADIVGDILDEFTDDIPSDVRDEIQDKILAALAE